MSDEDRVRTPRSRPRSSLANNEAEKVVSLISRKLPVKENLQMNRAASLESPRMASKIVSPPSILRRKLNKMGSRLPRQFFGLTGEEKKHEDLTVGTDRFIVFKKTNPSDSKTVDEDSIKGNASGALIEKKIIEPVIEKDLITGEERFVVFKETSPFDRKTVVDESIAVTGKTSRSLIEKTTTDPRIQKESKDDRFKNGSKIDKSSERRYITPIQKESNDDRVKNGSKIDKSSERIYRTSVTNTKNTVRSKIGADKQMTLGRKMPLISQEKKILVSNSQLKEISNLTNLKDSDDRHLMKGKNRAGRSTRLPRKTLELPEGEPEKKPLTNPQIVIRGLLSRKIVCSTLTGAKAPVKVDTYVGRSLLNDMAPIQTKLHSTERKPNEEETHIVKDAKDTEMPDRRRRLVTKLPSSGTAKTKVSVNENANVAYISKDFFIAEDGTVVVGKCPENQNELDLLRKSKVKDVKSKRSHSSTMSDPGSKWDIENKKRQKEFSDKIFKDKSRRLDRKRSGGHRTRHVSAGDVDSRKSSRTSIDPNKHSTASCKKICHRKKRSVSVSKRSRPKPILRKSPSSEDRNSEDDETQNEQSSFSQKFNRVRFDIPGSENSSLIKKSKKTANFLKNEINALKLMSSVIVEEDSDFPGDRSSKSSGEKQVSHVKSESERQKKTDSFGDVNPVRVVKDELEIRNHDLDVRADVKINENNVSVETLDDRKKHNSSADTGKKHEISLIPVCEMGAYMLKERIEAEYHRKRIALNSMILKLKGEQNQVMESYSKVSEEYNGLQRQGYDVAPVEDLLLVALDKVKDYLIAGQLANIRSSGDTDNKLSEDVSYTICVPSVEVLQGDAFLKDFKRKLRHFSARSYDTATSISEKLNGIIHKFKSGSLHKKNSEDSAKEGEASMVLCEQLKFELGNYTYEIMRDVKGLLKQNQLLSQLQQQVERKLEDVIPQKNEERKLELERMVEENRKLRRELRDSKNEVTSLREMLKWSNQNDNQTKTTIQGDQPNKENCPTDISIESNLDCNQEWTCKNEVPDDQMTTSSTSVKERFGVGAMELIEKYQARCCALEESIASVYNGKKALEKKLRKKINELTNELTATAQKLRSETDLRSDYEKDLEESERFISERESAMCRLIKLNDPSCRHPYPRLDMAPSEREKMTWIELQRARSLLKQTRNEVLKVTAERDECLSTVSRFLGTKTGRTGDHVDPDNRLVIVEDKLVEELRGQVAKLNAEVEKWKAQREKQRKEMKKLRSVLDGFNCGDDVQCLMSDNYDLKKKVVEMQSCQRDLSAKNEHLDALLCAKLFENAQRDRVMVEHCAAYEAHETLVALMNERYKGTSDGITLSGSATRIATLLTAAGTSIYNMVSGRRGNPD